MKLNASLAFDGSCAGATPFYEQKLGARIEMLMAYGGSPMAAQAPPETRKRVMHAQIGGDTLMASDAPAGQHRPMAGFYLSLMPNTLDKAARVSAALAKGGDVRLLLQATFWSPGFGMLADKSGTPWMVNTAFAA